MSAPSPFSACLNCLGPSSFRYEYQPGLLGEHVCESVKRCARFVRKALGIGHSQAVEKVAQAAGFPHWHALQTAAKRAAAEHGDPTSAGPAQRQDVANQQFDIFAKALPLLVQVSPDLPPDEDARAGLEAFAESLSRATELPIDRSRDLVARMLGSDTWRELCSRDPLDSKQPLYTFDAERGVFDWSDACQTLVNKQDSCFQEDGDFAGDLSNLDRNACFEWIAQTCARRPDFLEGLLALGTELEERGAGDAAGRCYRDAIRQADALIGNYRGQIIWGYLDNRFYHRLLCAFMQWSAYRGYLKQAIRLARRQLRLNPNDNLGIRYHLPVLLAADGQYDAMQRAIRKLRGEEQSGDPATHLVKSLCLMAPTATEDGIAEFLRALFLFPFLRDMMIDGAYPDPFSDDRSWNRGIVPNGSDIYFQCDVLFPFHPMIERTIRAILDDAEVQRTEAALAATYCKADFKLKNPQVIGLDDVLKRSRQLDVWRAQLGASVQDLAKRKSADWIRRLTS